MTRKTSGLERPQNCYAILGAKTALQFCAVGLKVRHIKLSEVWMRLMSAETLSLEKKAFTATFLEKRLIKKISQKILLKLF